MKNLQSSNPILKFARKIDGTGLATFNGILNKIMFLIFLTILGASFTWIKYINFSNDVSFFMWLGLIGGFIFALITSFIPSIAPFTVSLYALFEGLFLGGISAKFSYVYNGIVIQAVLITLSILIGMLILYRSKIIKATGRFKKGVFAATFGIGIVYSLNLILSLFGINLPFLHTSTPIGIGVSIFIIIIAALNFIIDFDYLNSIVYNGASKKIEWIGAFGIITTLIWMYIQVIRLLYILKED